MSSSLNENHIQTFAISELPVKNVVVYLDRAEVKRVVRTKVLAGRNRFVIKNISPVIESQSIRVEGQKSALISEVCYLELPCSEVKDSDSKLNSLESEKCRLENEKTLLEDQICLLKNQLDVLDGVAKQIGQNVLVTKDIDTLRRENNNPPTSPASAFLLCDDAMKNLTEFLAFYGNKASDMKRDIREKEKDLTCLREKIELLERELDRQRCRSEYDKRVRQIKVEIEAPEDGLVEIYVSYQVYCANWRPCYDIRASTSEFESAEYTKLQVVYWGIVEQKTDEDWHDAEVILSTAMPCLDGVLPTVPTLVAGLQRYQTQVKQLSNGTRRKPLTNDSFDEDIGIGSYDYNEYADGNALNKMAATQHTGSDSDLVQPADNIPSTYFPIEAHVAVEGNGQPQKLMIAKIELEPQFIHETTPSRAASAFVSAIVTNSSDLPFLPGSASIFLNNSFVATTSIRSILPGEEFRCLLGVDHAIKVEYKHGQKRNEQIGFMSKNQLATHEQTIFLRNAKVNQCANVTIREPIPKPNDDKIKVTILSPDIKNNRYNTEQARLSKENNLEWVVNLQPGEQKIVTVKYGIEYPLSENVVYTIAHLRNR
ncbi:protein F37C4.5 [Ditylenchus destructor]|nr:protein F37C4.5 [Ditylenchus destructor]